MSTDTETDFDQGIFTDPKIDNVQQMENDLQNPLNLLSSNEVLDNVKIYDSTVEIVGYVDGIESPRLVGDKQQYKFFKFFLNNANGRRVQVVAWNEEIKNVESLIIPNHIMHLDGVQARAPKHANFNNENVAYELHIKSNSIINSLGKYEPTSSSSHGPIPILLKDVMNSSGYIRKPQMFI
ncbi:uncharacterized protein LOC112467401 [Temnothorax curvispinosus]|uniref:Uncharacterized protein LOC112467401 n=1 Tax=Temnothorax curvispinosus TaxID=300111 RepID=A0A6J1RAN0_9HYME|nr:uncharacterized protein LOC112467401 [Temnothorax curvispinosus]